MSVFTNRYFLLLAFLLIWSPNLVAQNASDSLAKLANDASLYFETEKARDFYIQASASESDPVKRLRYLFDSELVLSQTDPGKAYSNVSSFRKDVEEINNDELWGYYEYICGRIKLSMDDWGAAKQHFEDSLNRYGDSISEDKIVAFNYLAYVSIWLVNPDTAIEMSREIIQISNDQAFPRGKALAYNNLIMAYEKKGLINRSGENARLYLDVAMENEIRESIGTAHSKNAQYYQAIGDYSSSNFHFIKALGEYKKYNDEFSVATTLSYLANSYYAISEFETALGYGEEAEKLFTKMDRPLFQSAIYNILSEIHRQLGDSKEALRYINLTIDLAENMDDKSRLNFALLSKAYLYEYDNDLDASYQVNQLLLSRTTDDFDWDTRLSVLNNLSDIEYIRGNAENSLQYSLKAYKLANQKELASRHQSASLNLARAYYRVQSDSTILYLDEFLDQFSSQQRNKGSITFESGAFITSAYNLCEAAGWVLDLQNDQEQAFNLIEQAKARALLNDLAQKNRKTLEELNEGLASRERGITSRGNELYSQLNSRLSQAKRDSLNQLIRQNDLEYEALTNELSISMTEIDSAPEISTLSEIQEYLDNHTLLVEYAFSREGLIVFGITQDSVKVKHFKNESDNHWLSNQFSSFVNDYRNSILEEVSKDSLASLSNNMLGYLFPDGFLEPEIDQIIIVPDRSLSILPFEALIKDANYLIQDYNIKYLPSASILPYIKPPNRIKKQNLYAYSNSDFSYPSNMPEFRNRFLAPLPFASIEVQTITENFDDFQTSAEINGPIEQTVTSTMDDYKYIHFATHGVVNEKSPLYSKLILSNRFLGGGFQNDDHLTAQEISSLNLKADMAVLSACNTGSGKFVNGEGFLGLQRSFLIAGSSSVVASLWEVYDQSTSTFMDNFYKNLIEQRKSEYGLWEKALDMFNAYEPPIFDHKSKALRDAKLAMLEHPYYKKPVYWAPFVYIGR